MIGTSGALAHSNCIIHTKRVGTNPLETQTFIKMSGPQPTRIINFNGKEWVHSLCKNTIIVKLCKKSKTFSVFMRMRPHSNRIIHAKRVGLGSLVRPRSNRQLTYKRADYRKASKPPKGEQAAQKRVNRQKTSGRRMAAQTYSSTAK